MDSTCQHSNVLGSKVHHPAVLFGLLVYKYSTDVFFGKKLNTLLMVLMLFGILRLTPTPIKTPLRLFYGALYLDLKTYLITIPWGPIRAVRNAQPSIDKNTMHGISTHFTKTTNNKQQQPKKPHHHHFTTTHTTTIITSPLHTLSP